MDGKQLKRRREITAELQQVAWLLRNRITQAENLLWKALCNRQLEGLKFRRQHPVGQFVLDFYCPRLKLVVEIDGGIHDTTAAQDTARTEYLNSYGYRIIRFQNEEVLTDLASVLGRIADATHDEVPSSTQ